MNRRELLRMSAAAALGWAAAAGIAEADGEDLSSSPSPAPAPPPTKLDVGSWHLIADREDPSKGTVQRDWQAIAETIRSLSLTALQGVNSSYDLEALLSFLNVKGRYAGQFHGVAANSIEFPYAYVWNSADAAVENHRLVVVPETKREISVADVRVARPPGAPDVRFRIANYSVISDVKSVRDELFYLSTVTKRLSVSILCIASRRVQIPRDVSLGGLQTLLPAEARGMLASTGGQLAGSVLDAIATIPRTDFKAGVINYPKLVNLSPAMLKQSASVHAPLFIRVPL